MCNLKMDMTVLITQEDTGGGVKVNESYWMLNDGELNINLQKMTTGETWLCALQGRAGQTVDDCTREEVKKKMMLERFQYEVSELCSPR